MKLTYFVLILSMAVVLFSSSYVYSKEIYGKLEGNVVDENGEPVADAKVVITSPLLFGGSRTTVTDHKGKYHFHKIPPGEYQLEKIFGVQLLEDVIAVNAVICCFIFLPLHLGQRALRLAWSLMVMIREKVFLHFSQ